MSKIYVGIGDWGRALYISEVETAHKPAAIVGENELREAQEDYSHLAPKLISPNPTHYS